MVTDADSEYNILILGFFFGRDSEFGIVSCLSFLEQIPCEEPVISSLTVRVEISWETWKIVLILLAVSAVEWGEHNS